MIDSKQRRDNYKKTLEMFQEITNPKGITLVIPESTPDTDYKNPRPATPLSPRRNGPNVTREVSENYNIKHLANSDIVLIQFGRLLHSEGSSKIYECDVKFPKCEKGRLERILVPKVPKLLINHNGTHILFTKVEAIDHPQYHAKCISIVGARISVTQEINSLLYLDAIRKEYPELRGIVPNLYDVYAISNNNTVICDDSLNVFPMIGNIVITETIGGINISELRNRTQEGSKDSFVIVPRVLGILENLLHSLKVLHSRGIYHLNITSKTVLIDAVTYNTQLIDFGNAALASREARESDETFDNFRIARKIPKGKLRAPEMYGPEKSYHPQYNDIWDLGVMLFLLCKGDLYPDDFGQPESGRELCIDDSTILEYLPPVLRTILLWMLSYNPLSRPSADELLEFLQKVKHNNSSYHFLFTLRS